MPKFCLAGALALVLASALPAQDAPAAPKQEDAFRWGGAVPAGMVAVIGGRGMTLPEFVALVWDRYRGHPKGTEALEDLVNRTVIREQMKARGLAVADGELDAHYEALDRRYREATKGELTIASYLEKEGLSRETFMQRLRMQLALEKMTKADFERDDVTAADQATWLRSKIVEARLEQDPQELPENAAARVGETFVTKEEFARNLIKLLPERDVVALLRTRLEALHAVKMLEDRGLELDDEAREAQYRRFRGNFERNPKFEGIEFADFVRERTGMDLEAYKKSSTFTREGALFLLGDALVSDDEAPAAYERMKDAFGPRMDVRHIFLRATDDPNDDSMARSFAEAKTAAEAILDRVKKGDEFLELVKVLSEDPRTKFSGGQLGVFTPVSVKEFPPVAEVLGSMKLNDVRGPIRSSQGYHLIKLVGIEPAPPLSPEIVEEVRRRAAVEAFLESFSKASKGVDLRRFVGAG